MPEINIHPLAQQHMTAVVDMLHQGLSEYRPPKEQFNEIWHDFKGQNHLHARVAIFKEQVVGYASLTLTTTIRGGKLGHIEDVVSHPDHQRQGIGKALIHNLSELGKELGCYKIVLCCKAHNIDFYRKCGFETTGVSMEQFQGA